MSVYVFRYEREDGEFRQINVPGASVKEARELADRRLDEQYGWRMSRREEPVLDASGNPTYDDEARQVFEEIVEHFPPSHNGVERPDLLQEHYRLVSINGKAVKP